MLGRTAICPAFREILHAHRRRLLPGGIVVQLNLDRDDMIKDETIDLLNELIHVCKDGEHGYRTAAEDVRNSQLQSVFSEYAKQRSSFARQLQAEVERLGGAATDSGTLTAAAHRGWMDLKAALSGGDGARSLRHVRPAKTTRWPYSSVS